ncbi:dynein light chain Tctex-type 5-B-like isoform X1 [Haliotis rufescens]|uniref:dynein light chain Tctex-type 5-B-like isoform X1 n=1 Tax=Haliotis rufescens TaxID=6454 RepID=UPI00201F82B6|nr:dynein light chain Tctex-type 5-B-like isoform X1 [Haliotis rufescens]XP_048252423.1 dynein light chain Tctex-type 5-B-like isoform X1 [Haliotis rufescens]
MTTERLTMHALKQNDNVHPTFKASTSGTGSKELPRQISRSELDVQPKKRTRAISNSETSPKSLAQPTKPKMSIFKLVAATRAWRRLATKNSKSNSSVRPPPKLENTFKLKPDDRKRFMPRQVEKLLADVLAARLDKVEYDPRTCRDITTDISAHIKARVKAMDFPRYKIVSNVIIMENKGQGAQVASRCVWDASSDSFATYTYRNHTLVATAYVHGVYYE